MPNPSVHSGPGKQRKLRNVAGADSRKAPTAASGERKGKYKLKAKSKAPMTAARKEMIQRKRAGETSPASRGKRSTVH